MKISRKIKQFCVIGFAAFCASMFSLIGCVSTEKPTKEETANPDGLWELDTFNFTSKLVGPNEQTDRAVTLLLPPSYYLDENKRYPVVYALHGFGSGQGELISASRDTLVTSFQNHQSPEYIIVGINGSNSLGGSFYVNSPATGLWEDMVIQEAIPQIEQNYRIIADVNHRMVAGFGMGGFAAWNLALRHPDIFCAAWACDPGAFDPQGLEKTYKLWPEVIRTAYGAAFAPDLSIPYPHARFPKFDGTAADNTVVSLWKDGFGGVEKKLRDYKTQKVALKAMRFDYALFEDPGFYIGKGTVFIEAQLRAAGINTSIHGWPGGHSISKDMIEKGFIPFVAGIFGSAEK